MSDAQRDEVWSRAVRRKDAAVTRAYAGRDEVIRAAHADGVPVTVIAAALGVRGRKGIYAVLSGETPAGRKR